MSSRDRMMAVGFVALVLLGVCQASAGDIFGEIGERIPDIRIPNPFNPPPPTSSTFGVDAPHGSELQLTNRTGSTITIEPTVYQRGTQPVRLGRRTLAPNGTATWTGINRSSISLVSAVAYRPNSNTSLRNWNSLGFSKRDRHYSSQGASPGATVTTISAAVYGRVDVGRVDFTGKYDSDKGYVEMAQNGDHVSGLVVYPNRKAGSFSGTVRGNRLDFTWKNSVRSGTGYLILTSDGRFANGGGRENGGNNFNWSMRRR